MSKMTPDIFPELLVKSSHVCNLNKDEVLFQPQDEVDSVFYILKGELMAMRYQLDGKPAVMMRNFAGEIFAPASLAMDHYPCSGVAVSACQLLQIPKQIFNQSLENYPDFTRYYIESLGQDLKKQCTRSERL